MAAAGLLGDRVGPIGLLNAQALLYLGAGLTALIFVGVRNAPDGPIVIPAARSAPESSPRPMPTG